MGQNTKIQWCDHTFNPWRGCTKVSPGCKNCYAERMSLRNPKVLGIWGPDGTRPIASSSMWGEPEKWDSDAEREGVRMRVFCASLADVFEPREDLIDPRKRLFQLIRDTTNLDWLILTKRPELIKDLMPHGDWSNVWLGTSVESQDLAWRLDALLESPQVVPVHFCSAEPLLGHLDLLGVLNPTDGINWTIVGGESGSAANTREMRFSWVMSIIAQCAMTGTACFVKQLGDKPISDVRGLAGGPYLTSVSKGGDPDEWPSWMRVRLFPDVSILR